MTRVPPRLFVICARDVDIAAVILRGPSAWAHLIKWDMAHDTFEHGAWLKGRIYAEKCDLSPDGNLLVYFVHDGKAFDTSYTHAWTGVSRLPWLTALGLWPNGTTYGGGGRFVDDRHVLLRADPRIAAHPDHPGEGIELGFASPDEHASSNAVEGAEWSGRDRRGRVIHTKGGKLYRRSADGKRNVQLADFNGLAPDPRPAPAWATRPLR